MSGLFVTSTGTGIGKTLVATLLIGRLREQGRAVAALKPVITGFDPAEAAASDTGLLLAALGRAVTAENVAAISPWRFAAPLSPDMAASREGATLSAAAIAAFCRDADRPGQVTLAEGIGGAMAPLGGRETLLDAMAALGWPAVLVTGSYLGTLSHTLTAARALAGAGVNLAGVAISESPESPVPPAETAAALSRYVGAAPVIVLPRFDPAGPPPPDLPDLTVLAGAAP
jgi:dethiobiotin synthetase